MQVTVAVIPGNKRPVANLYHEQQYLGKIVILSTRSICIETASGRRDNFRSIETCARFCGCPTSDTIELLWTTESVCPILIG